MPDPRTSLLTAAGLGAGLMYLLDPDHGARRRSRVRDVCSRVSRRTTDAAATTGRDASHRFQGIMAALRNSMRREQIDDDVLKERVRATMGHYVSHSHAIEVTAIDGVVRLKGPILRGEAAGLLSAIRSVRGVSEVVDALDRH